MGLEEKKKISITELAYLLYFTVMFGARVIGLFEGMLIYNVSLVIGMLLFAVKVSVTEHTVLEYLFAGCLLLISMLVYHNTGEKGLLLYFTMMLGMKGVSVKRVFKLGTMLLSVAFTVLVFLSVTGLRQDIIYIHDRAGFGRIIRHSLGYPYPNTLFTTYIVLMALIFYMLGKQTKKNLLLTTFLMFLGSVYIYLYSCSNTGLIVSVFYLLMNLYLQLRKNLSKLEKTGFVLLYPVCMLFSIVGPLVTTGRLFALLDRVLHNRWAYSLYYLTNEPVTLLGVRFQEAPNTNYMIDSSFLYSFLQLGVIPCVILTVLMVGMIYDHVKQGRKKELAIIASFCVLGLSDPFLFNLSYKNLMFLFAGEFVYSKLEILAERRGGLLNRKIQLLRVGNKEISYGTAVYCKCSEGLKKLGRTISGHSGVLTLVYSVSLVLISGVLYGATQSGYIVGRIDDVEEWEYFRKVLSCGVFAGAVFAGGLAAALLKRGNQRKVCFIAQFPPPIHGLSAAVDMLYQSFLSGEFQFEKVNITDNHKILSNIWMIIRSRADLYYFTISQTRIGNLRDLAILQLLRWKNGKRLVHLHGGYYREMIENELPGWQKQANYRVIGRLDGVIVLGDSLKPIFKGMIPEQKIFVVPNCADDQYIADDSSFGKKMDLLKSLEIKHVLYLSNFIKSKGYEQVLEIARMEKDSCDKGRERRLHFDFAGKFFDPEEEEEFFQYINKNNLQEYVTYHGVVTEKRKQLLLEQSIFFVLLTRYPKEGQPISILEAMGNGMVVITTDHAAIPDMVQNGVNGIVCTQNMAVEDIYKKILQLKTEQIKNICLANRMHIKNVYSQELHLENMRNIFNMLLKE